jgi:hypothetical protein
LRTDVVSAAFRNPAFSKSARVPTYAMVRSTFAPRLSTGYPSIAGAPRERANSTAPASSECEMPRPRCPGRTRMHHTDHTSRSSTRGIVRPRAKVVSVRGATAAHPTTSSPSYASTPSGPSSISSATFSPRAGPRSDTFSFDGMR